MIPPHSLAQSHALNDENYNVNCDTMIHGLNKELQNWIWNSNVDKVVIIEKQK